jgi:hypothetical protein
LRPWRGYTRLMRTVVSLAVGLDPSGAVPSAPGRHSCISTRSPAQAAISACERDAWWGPANGGDDRICAFSRQLNAGQGPEGVALFEPASGREQAVRGNAAGARVLAWAARRSMAGRLGPQWPPRMVRIGAWLRARAGRQRAVRELRRAGPGMASKHRALGTGHRRFRRGRS